MIKKIYPFSSSYSSYLNNVIIKNNTTLYREYDGRIKSDTELASIDFKNTTFKDILDVYEHSTLNVTFDSRNDTTDCERLILGRNHMFYAEENMVDKEELNRNLKEELHLNKVKLSNLMNEITNQLVLNNKTEYVDAAVEVDTVSKLDMASADKRDNIKLEDVLNRKNIRKFSENHFAISKYNLLFQEISVNQVANTCVFFKENNETERKNSISILGPTSKMSNFKEKIIKINVDDNKDDRNWFMKFFAGEKNIMRNNEYLANELLKELSYAYSGKIIIKYNPDIEVNDTITLLDASSQTYGIFAIDAFEHSLDTRGLITTLNVKALWKIADPTLHHYSIKIGYKLLNELCKKGSYTKEEKENIEQYMKTLLITPKYCNFYNLKAPGMIFKNILKSNNFYSPTHVPIMFFPMIKKYKVKIPNDLLPAFFNVVGSEFSTMYDYIMSLSTVIGNTIETAGERFIEFSKKAFLGVLDVGLATVTFGFHYWLKPFFNITYNNAIEKTYDKTETTSTELAIKGQYNRYESKVGSFRFCFYNINFQQVSNLYQGVKPNNIKESEFNDKIGTKINSISNSIKDADKYITVELYDKFNDHIQDNDSLKAKYTYQSIATQLDPNGKLNKIATNAYTDEGNQVTSNEYAMTNFLDYSVHQFVVDSNRSYICAVQHFLDTKIVIYAFHNIYGESKENINTIERRKKIVDEIVSVASEYKKNNPKDIVVIAADFNMEVYNEGSNPSNSSAANNNNVYKLTKDSAFTALVVTPTVIKSSTNDTEDGNIYDNFLIDKESKKLYECKAISVKKLTSTPSLISDHIPIYLEIAKKA